MKTRRYLLVMMMVGVILVSFGCAEKESSQVKEVETETETQIETDAVVTIEGTTFTYDDMEFYTFMKRLKNEWSRIEDARNLKDEALLESEAYWDAQNEHYEKTNAQLQNLIEIHAMSLLAEEKNYFVPDDKLEHAVDELNLVIEANEPLQKIVSDYGDKEFRLNITDYMRKSMLLDRIAQDIEKTVLEEIPNANKQELKYEVNTRYDELAMDQLSGLDMTIHIK